MSTKIVNQGRITQTDAPLDWPEGTLKSSKEGVRVLSASGAFLAEFRADSSCLRYTTCPPTMPKKDRAWHDTTEVWAAFPKWVRVPVLTKLGLWQ